MIHLQFSPTVQSAVSVQHLYNMLAVHTQWKIALTFPFDFLGSVLGCAEYLFRLADILTWIGEYKLNRRVQVSDLHTKACFLRGIYRTINTHKKECVPAALDYVLTMLTLLYYKVNTLHCSGYGTD